MPDSLVVSTLTASILLERKSEGKYQRWSWGCANLSECLSRRPQSCLEVPIELERVCIELGRVCIEVEWAVVTGFKDDVRIEVKGLILMRELAAKQASGHACKECKARMKGRGHVKNQVRHWRCADLCNSIHHRPRPFLSIAIASVECHLLRGLRSLRSLRGS